MTTKIIHFYGGPGSGKSTMAASLFAMLKHGGHCAELVTEEVKKWAWTNRPVNPHDQLLISSTQTAAEISLLGKVDFIVSDAPPRIALAYTKPDTAEYTATESIIKTYEAATMCLDTYRYVVVRSKKYDTRGRYQTFEQAKEKDIQILGILQDSYGNDFSVVKYSPTVLQEIYRAVTGTEYQGMWGDI